MYRMFHLKCNPNYFTWNPSHTKWRNQWEYSMLAVISRCCSWCTAWNQYCHNLSCFVAWWALVTDKNFLCYKILFGVSLSYFLVRIHIAKCFTNSSKQFWYEVMIKNKNILLVNTPCSHLHSFCAVDMNSGLATRVTLTRESLGRLGESITQGLACFWFHVDTAVHDYCWVAF
jgi:hypothetical protein